MHRHHGLSHGATIPSSCVTSKSNTHQLAKQTQLTKSHYGLPTAVSTHCHTLILVPKLFLGFTLDVHDSFTEGQHDQAAERATPTQLHSSRHPSPNHLVALNQQQANPPSIFPNLTKVFVPQLVT